MRVEDVEMSEGVFGGFVVRRTSGLAVEEMRCKRFLSEQVGCGNCARAGFHGFSGCVFEISYLHFVYRFCCVSYGYC